MIDGLLLDARAAMRSLRRSPAFTATVITCLALGLGATTAVFSVVKTVLLQPLPFPEPDRLANLWVGYDNEAIDARFFVSPQQYVEIRERSSVLSSVAASRVEDFSLESGEYPVEVTGARVTSSLFPLVGAAPVVGRLFTEEEDRNGALVALIGEGLRDRTYGGKEAVGDAIRLNGLQYQIVGVLPHRARVPPDVEVWIPLSVDRIERRDRLTGSLTVVAQLATGVTTEVASTELTTVAREIARDFPDRNTNLKIGLLGWQTFLVENVRTAILIVLLAVVGVLALAVSNVASLLTVRAQYERRPRALRAALGASSRRIIRYMLVENGLLVIAGAVLGVVTAHASLPVLLALQPESLSPFRTIAIDTVVLSFTLGVLALIVCVMTLFDALWLRYGSLTTRLVEGGAGTGVTRRAARVQRLLVVGQVAGSVVLLVGSTLMVRSFTGIGKVDPGFDPAPVLAVRVAAPPARADTHEERGVYFEEVLEAVRAVPGVETVGAAHTLPISGIRWGMGYSVEGQPPETPSQRHVAVWRLVTRGYYDAMGISVLRGRAFDERDRPGSEPVAIVSEALAATHWPGEDPIGKRVKRGTYGDPSEPWRTVIGVIPDIRDSALAGPPRAAIHFPHIQHPTPVGARMSIVVRATGSMPPEDLAGPVEAVIRRVDGAALVHEITAYRSLLGESIAQERFNTLVLSIFAAAGLVLASIGTYGVVSYSVARRRREFGIRLACGAKGWDVRRLMLRAGALMAGTGITIGVLISFAAAPLLQPLLVTGGARDPLPYLVAATTLFVTTVLAGWIPAQRATRVDPVIVLGSEQ